VKRILLIAAAFALFVVPAAAIAAAGFTDVADDSVFVADIQWMKDNDITRGCNPPTNDRYCPSNSVTREQMSAFMHRLAVNQVVDAATAIQADNATTADHATTADNATDADTLDGLDSTAFARSDAVVAGYFSCAGTSHVPRSNTSAWNWSNSMLYHTGGSDLYRCNLDIPTGATVNVVRWSVNDTNNAAAVSCAVWRTNMVTNVGTEVRMATANSGAATLTPGQIQISDSSVAYPTIDRKNYSYFAQCSLGGTTTSTGLYGVTVGYDYNPTLSGATTAEPGQPSEVGSTD